jgi:hypothetical protein
VGLREPPPAVIPEAQQGGVVRDGGPSQLSEVTKGHAPWTRRPPGITPGAAGEGPAQPRLIVEAKRRHTDVRAQVLTVVISLGREDTFGRRAHNYAED